MLSRSLASRLVFRLGGGGCEGSFSSFSTHANAGERKRVKNIEGVRVLCKVSSFVHP